MVKRCLAELGVDPKRYPPRAVQHADLERQEPADRPRRLRRDDGRRLRGDRRRGLPALREADARGQRDGLRRPAGAHGQRAGAVRGRARALAAHLPPRPRRRVPGHQPRPVPAAAAARRGARQPDGGRRRRPVDLQLPRRRRPQHPRLRATTSRKRAMVKLEQNYRSTQTILSAANAVVSRNRERAAEGALDRQSPAAIRCSSTSSATSTRRRAGWRGRSSGSPRRRSVERSEVAVFYRTNAMSRVLEDTLVRFDCQLPGDRRHQVLRAGRDQGRLRLPRPPRQPAPTWSSFGRIVNSPAARDRRHQPGPAGSPTRTPPG